MTQGPLERVVLRAYEAIAPFGTLRQTWLVFQDGQWNSVKAITGAQLTSLDAGAGTVWESEAVLQLARGTRVQRVQRRPLPERHDDPMSYLARGKLSARQQIIRRYYRVAARGALKPDNPGEGEQSWRVHHASDSTRTPRR
jgi:hypothetical protein